MTLNELFSYMNNSFELMKRLKKLEEIGFKEIMVRRGFYISIKKIKKILYDYSEEGYSLGRIQKMIRENIYD